MIKARAGTPNLNARTEQIIRFAGFLMPVVLVLYGMLVVLGAVRNTLLLSVPIFAGLSVFWLMLSIYQFLIPAHSRTESALRLIAYHALAASYILIVSGLDMPFLGTWIVLFLASYAYFGRDGLNLSIFALFATAVAAMFLHMEDTEYIVRSGLYFIGTLVVGYIAGVVTSSSEVDRVELSRSRAQESLQRDRIMTIVNNLADGILSTDKDGIVRAYNAASLNLLDTNNELAGQPIDKLLHLKDTDNKPFSMTKAFRAARSVVSRDDLSATISDETIRLSVIYSPIRGADSHDQETNDGYIVILRDITKQKSLEEERDEFISVVSHELRTPITIAEGSLSNLQFMMDRSDIPKTTLVENVNMSHDQILFLARMVNDLSTLSRAERGVGDTVEDIDINELIQGLYSEYAPQAQAKGLRFDLDLSPQLGVVSASRLYLKELLQNFVTNAIKYTKEGGVTVRVKKAGTLLDFSVTDTGIGISKADQQHIYERFWRSEDYRTRETGGTGLGLYVATKLSKKLGTRIELTSRINHGSTFGFSLEQKHTKSS